ncbi:hypothetical protein JXA56_00715 [Candidatus Micrarchaeota archaeon]|nr:hypothetical protein [Candidatus Micrarchaeota archaeon]
MVQPAQKKKTDIRERFNEFLDDVFQSGPRFSMENLRRYEQTAIESRELRTAKPRKSDIGQLVAKRIEETRISRHMTATALDAALKLGEELETATESKSINFKKWVRG